MEKQKLSNEIYFKMVENANEAIIVIQDGKIKFFNPKILEYTGYSQKELENKPFIDFIHFDDKKILMERHLRRLQGEEFTHIYPFRLIAKNNEVRWVQVNAIIFEWEEKPATLNFITDISEQKKVEQQLEKYYLNLENLVKERTSSFYQISEKLKKLLDNIVQAFVLTVETRDSYTSGHQQRVALLSCAIAKKMNLSNDQIDAIRISSLIHDFGKIYIPIKILNKPKKLNKNEFKIMKTHPQIGYNILKEIEFPWPIAQIVWQHHEKLDGSGYPNNLLSQNILLEAKVLTVSDVIEAMTSDRPYRLAMSIEETLEEITEKKNILYDSDVVDAFLKIFKEKKWEKIKNTHRWLNLM
ncbi:MAG: HD domain-containing phosphohydrolase [bacterium]